MATLNNRVFDQGLSCPRFRSKPNPRHVARGYKLRRGDHHIHARQLVQLVNRRTARTALAAGVKLLLLLSATAQSQAQALQRTTQSLTLQTAACLRHLRSQRLSPSQTATRSRFPPSQSASLIQFK